MVTSNFKRQCIFAVQGLVKKSLPFLPGKKTFCIFLYVHVYYKAECFYACKRILTMFIIGSEILQFLVLYGWSCKIRTPHFLPTTVQTDQSLFLNIFLYLCNENTQNISGPVTVVHGRRFHHAHAQTTVVKTAAQR